MAVVATPVAIGNIPLTSIVSRFAVNATSADASGCEVIKAAPSAGYSIYITHLSVMIDANITVTIGEGETASAVDTIKIGPIPSPTEGLVWQKDFPDAIQLTAATLLAMDASGAGNVCVYVEGFVA